MLRYVFKDIRVVAALAVFAILIIILVIGGVRMMTSSRTPEPVETVFLYPETPPEGRLPEGVRPLHYALDFRIIPEEDYFSGTATIEVEVDLHTRFIWLHGRDLNVARVEVRKTDGTILEAAWQQVTEGGVAKIVFAKTIRPGTLVLQIEYDAPYSKNPDGLYKVVSDDEAMVFSQFQSIDARRAFPGFDEPRFKVPFDISIIAPAGVQVITNTPRVDLMAVGEQESLYLFDTSVALHTAIVSFAVGNFDVVDGGVIPPGPLRAAEIPLRGFARKGHGPEMQAMLAATAPLVASLESYYEEPYPYKKLDLVAVPDFVWAGMENAASIFYREDYIFVTDDMAAQDYYNVIDTHAHELAHQWFGNLVTPAWWDDIWLNESFASWISGKAIAELDVSLGAEDVVKRYAHEVMEQDSRPSTLQVYQPVEDNEDIMVSFSDIAYFKGSGVLQMFEAYVGAENFREGIAAFIKRHKGGTATLDDFVEAISVGSGHPEIAPSFRSFIMQPGLPVIEAAVNCTGGVKEISFIQSRFYPLGAPAQDETFWEVPICYRTDTQNGCHLLTEKRQTVRLGKACPAFVMPNKDASGYYLWSLDETSLGRLRRNLSKLTPIESESLAYNLIFWFRSDRISASQTLDFVEGLAALERPRTDLVLLQTMSDLRVYLEAREDIEQFDAWVNHLYGPRSRGLGFNPGKKEAAGRSILRDRLTEFLVAETANTDVRKRLLANLKRQNISIAGGFTNQEAVFDHNRASAILALGVLDTGNTFTDDLVELASLKDAGEHDHMILEALSITKNKALGRRLLDDLLLSDHLRSESVFTLAAGLAGNPAQTDGFWLWIGRSDNLDKLLARMPESSRYELVGYGASICDQSQRDRFEDVIGNRLEDISGGTSVYAQTLEAIDQCLAVKAAKGPELAAAVK